MERKILHLDLDAFFCSVEELLNPDLVGKAFAVGGSPQGRGVVSSCSYAARKFGIRSAMPMARAIGLYPALLVVSHRHGVYGQFSDKVMEIMRGYSPLFEQVSVDEAFLDVSDLSQSLSTIAGDLQLRVEQEVGLPCSIGGATNKLVAKVANDFGKASVRSDRAPRQITIIPPGNEADFLKDLNIQALWGIGPKTAQKLSSMGIKTIGQIAELPQKELELVFGKMAFEIHQRALGIDPSPVATSHEVKSISNEITFPTDITETEELLRVLRKLSDKVGYRLRQSRLAGSAIHIKIRYEDFSTLTRQKAVKEPTNLDDQIYTVVKQLLLENLSAGRPVRLIGVGISNLDTPHQQLSLWEDTNSEKHDLYSAIDHLKEKYGRDIIQRASMLQNKKKHNDNQ